MSLDALAWVFNCSPLTGTGLLVHLALADVSDDQRDDELFASQNTLSVRARTTRTTVNKVIADLTERGLLTQVGVLPGGTLRLRLLMPEMPKVGAIKRSDRISYPGSTAVKRAPKRSGEIPPVPPRPPSVGASNKHTPMCVNETRGVGQGDAPLSALAKHTEPFNQLTNQKQTLATDKPSRRGTPKGRQYTDEAQALATAEWERRTIKPAIGFVGFRKGIDAALAAGHAVEDLARVLPSMSNFSPNAFDFVLGGKGRAGRPGLRSVPPPSTDRDAPTGKVAT